MILSTDGQTDQVKPVYNFVEAKGYNNQLLWWNFWSNINPYSEQNHQDHDLIETGSFVESDQIEKSWAAEKLLIWSRY